MHEKARHPFDELFASGATRPRSMAELIKHYASNEDFLYEIVNPVYERATGSTLPKPQMRELLWTVPQWPLFFITSALFYLNFPQPDFWGVWNQAFR